MQSPISTQQIQLIQTSFSLIQNQSEQFSDLFYQTLFDLNPSVKAIFPADMDAQKRKLSSMINLLVNSCEVYERLTPAFKQLGESHKHLNLTEQDFEIVKQALLVTLEQLCGSSWNLETKQAWAEFYGAIVKAMMEVD